MILIALFWIVFVAVTGVMAAKRGRNVLGWVVLSIFFSPLLGILLLLLVGSSEDKKMERIASEEALRREIRGEKLQQGFKIERYDSSTIRELIEDVVMDNRLIISNRKITCYANQQTYEKLCECAQRMQYASGSIPYFQMKSGKSVGLGVDNSLADEMVEVRFELQRMI